MAVIGVAVSRRATTFPSATASTTASAVSAGDTRSTMSGAPKSAGPRSASARWIAPPGAGDLDSLAVSRDDRTQPHFTGELFAGGESQLCFATPLRRIERDARGNRQRTERRELRRAEIRDKRLKACDRLRKVCRQSDALSTGRHWRNLDALHEIVDRAVPH